MKTKQIVGIVILTIFFLIGIGIGPDPISISILMTIGYIIYSSFSYAKSLYSIITIVFLFLVLAIYRFLLSFVVSDFSKFYIPSIILYAVVIGGFWFSTK